MNFKTKINMENKLKSILIAHNMYGIENLNEAVKEIFRLFEVSKSLDFRELESELDEVFEKETKETLTEWLKNKNCYM